ncbi:MAG: hypothetical protein C0597_08015 [Marinilabiliales bacterium]|nr:MAG: hypothetical protein C0597_08015 [Marinilabiliales bacterium]
MLTFSFSQAKDYPDQRNYSNFIINLELDPVQKLISVEGILEYLVFDDSLTDFSFNLHKQFNIEYFKIDDSDLFQIDSSVTPVRWQPEAVKIVTRGTKVYRKGDLANIKFSYSGRITDWPSWSANVVDKEWVEMGLYFPWYPEFGEKFTYELSVGIDPAYHVFALGEQSEKSKRIIFKNLNPVTDLIVCASKDLSISELVEDDYSLKMVNTGLQEETIDLMQSDIAQILKNYSQWFGSKEKLGFSLVISKREKGGGYVRESAICLGGLKDSTYLSQQNKYIRYLSHEIAHLWWFGAEHNWEDWLNESFAEYSAMMMIREIAGVEEFNSMIQKKIQESQNTVAVWGMDRNNPDAQKVLYSKGPILLKELEDKIGKEKFIALCRKRVENEINTSEGFLTLLRNNESQEIEDWFREALKR